MHFKLLFLIIMVFSLSTDLSSENSFDKRPNIIIVLLDDLGWSDLGSYGGEIETPVMDELAYEGIRFTQFHNTSKCFPSRACLLTGIYAQQSGMDGGAGYLKNSVTLAQVLKEAGYRTIMSGKYHGLDKPVELGFDRHVGLQHGACNYFNPGVQRKGEGRPSHKRGFYPRPWLFEDLQIAPFTPADTTFYTTDFYTDYAINRLEEYKDEGKPFFLYLAYQAPHDPLQAWSADIKKYINRYATGYDAVREARYQRQKDMNLIDESYPLSEVTWQSWSWDKSKKPETNYLQKYGWQNLSQEEKSVEDSIQATYAAMVDRVDQNLSRLLTKLKELDKLDNTIIFICSDNGTQFQGPDPEHLTSSCGAIGSLTRWTSQSGLWANVGNTPYKYFKDWSHQGGICTPLIVWYPKMIKPGGITDFPGHFVDFMPTIIDLANASYPEVFQNQKIIPQQGISLLPVLQGKALERGKPLYWQWHKGKAIRYKHWKLVSGNDGPWELYDMRHDKTETRDLSDQYPQVVSFLSDMFEEWLIKTNRQSKSFNP